MAYFLNFNIRILHEHLVDALNDHSVGISEVAIEALVHLVDNALQGICFLVRYLRCKPLGGREDSRFLVQNNTHPKSFVQGSVFQLDLILNVHKFVFIGIGQQPCKVKRDWYSLNRSLSWRAHKLCNVGICAIELANIIAGGATVFLQISIPCRRNRLASLPSATASCFLSPCLP